MNSEYMYKLKIEYIYNYILVGAIKLSENNKITKNASKIEIQ